MKHKYILFVSFNLLQTVDFPQWLSKGSLTRREPLMAVWPIMAVRTGTSWLAWQHSPAQHLATGLPHPPAHLLV